MLWLVSIVSSDRMRQIKGSSIVTNPTMTLKELRMSVILTRSTLLFICIPTCMTHFRDKLFIYVSMEMH